MGAEKKIFGDLLQIIISKDWLGKCYSRIKKKSNANSSGGGKSEVLVYD